MNIIADLLNIDRSIVLSILTFLDCMFCSGSMVLLINYRRHGAQYKFWTSLLAYILIIAFASVPLFLFLGDAERVDLSETVLSAFLFLCIYRAKGNVSILLRGHNADSKYEPIKKINTKKVKL